MQTVQSIALEIVAREGGYVNDPDDPGGPTNHGVTLQTLRRLKMDVDRDGDVDVNDVQRLSQAQAVDIFKEHYFNAPGLAQLPDVLHATVFDMYVNAGTNAVKILQRLLGDFGIDVRVDGAIGPQTANAAARVWAMAPHHLVDAYGIARRNYYYALADMRPSSRKYARRRDGGKGGWITRAESFISQRYHLTDDQHTERTASWD